MLHFKIFGIAILTLLLKWVVLTWISEKGAKLLDSLIRKLLGDKPEELAIWLHYRKKHAGSGHQYPNPLRCKDDDCVLVHL